MQISRRNFVQTLTTAAAITVSVGGVQNVFGGAAADRLSTSPRNLFSMKSSQVKSFVGRTFIATSPDGQTAQLVLSEVNEVDRSANRQLGYSGECFSAIFLSVDKEGLGQGVYTLRSGSLDEFSALLVPTDRHSREYEMIVNRLTQ